VIQTLELNLHWNSQLLAHVPSTVRSLFLGFYNGDEDFRIQDNPHMRSLLTKLTQLAFGLPWPTALEKSVLALCNNLQVLTLNINIDAHKYFDNAGVDFDTGATISLPHLRRLSIQDVTAEYPIIRSLHTPALRELDLEFYCEEFCYGITEDPKGAVREIASFIERSQCSETLKRVRLASMRIDAEGLESFLQMLPPITHLTLDYITAPSQFFKNPTTHQQKLLPCLEVFGWFHARQDTQVEHICEYFSRRLQHNHGIPLKKLTMELDPGTQPAPALQNHYLRDLKDHGVDVDIHEVTIQRPSTVL
jgi:hypothetical protein